MHVLFTFLIPWRKINPKNHSYGFVGIIMCFVSRPSFDYNKKILYFGYKVIEHFVLFGSLRFEQ